MYVTPEKLAECLEQMKTLATQVDRAAALGPLEITVIPGGRLSREWAEQFVELGVDRIVVSLVEWEVVVARRPEVFVRSLSMEEGHKPQRITRTAKVPVRVRRAIVVLMSGQGQAVRNITALIQVSADYVRDVSHAFNERGFAALNPKWSGGRPRRIGEQVRERICLIARTSTYPSATAMQESGLRNLNYGDRDSLGLFQQRPSQGWGTPTQITNPTYAATQFYRHLLAIPNWQNISLNAAAQTVQRSATPNAYGQDEVPARILATTFAGATCTPPATPS